MPVMLTSSFPRTEAEGRVRLVLKRLHDDLGVAREVWEPDLDSLAIVDILCEFEDLFPFKIPPERVVRRGGYRSVEDGVVDIVNRFEELWNERQKREAA